VIVTDRPVPLPNLVDGPIADPSLESFVSPAPLPLAFGMTPGETALWLQGRHQWPLDLRVATMAGYHRQDYIAPESLPWAPPSPAIMRWDTAFYYPATVLFEAFADIELFRKTGHAFQQVGAHWMNAPAVCEVLEACAMRGVRFSPCLYESHRRSRPRQAQAVRLQITDLSRYRPAHVAVSLLHAIRVAHGPRRPWNSRGARPDFFDALAGNRHLQQELRADRPPREITRAWTDSQRKFKQQRSRVLLYANASAPTRAEKP